mmetsp:Transcript_92263/g.192965  ORF Transcript_92263/g.192965 Transcript_92263/m.192965 type:complete len:97 (+) Transcript_92263:3924-4214(+)
MATRLMPSGRLLVLGSDPLIVQNYSHAMHVHNNSSICCMMKIPLLLPRLFLILVLLFIVYVSPRFNAILWILPRQQFAIAMSAFSCSRHVRKRAWR